MDRWGGEADGEGGDTDDDGGVEALPGRVVAELPRPTLQRRAPSLGIPLCLHFFSCFCCFDILVGCEWKVFRRMKFHLRTEKRSKPSACGSG